MLLNFRLFLLVPIKHWPRKHARPTLSISATRLTVHCFCNNVLPCTFTCFCHVLRPSLASITSPKNTCSTQVVLFVLGSPAERCGRLQVGDRILAVNHVDINSLHHEKIINIIKESGYSVTLTVGPPIGGFIWCAKELGSILNEG